MRYAEYNAGRECYESYAAYNAGRERCERGGSLNDCPYLLHTKLKEAWRAGYLEARRARYLEAQLAVTEQ